MAYVSPQWVRETLCEDLADLARKAGKMPDSRRIEKIVDEDLRVFQAEERRKGTQNQKHVMPSSINVAPATTRDGLDKIDPAADLADRHGFLLKRGLAPTMDERAPGRCLCGVCKVCKLSDRIATLVQIRPGTKPAQRDFMFRKYAEDVLYHWWHWRKFTGPYAQLEAKDTNRAFWRAMENIADRSTAELGNWWVK